MDGSTASAISQPGQPYRRILAPVAIGTMSPRVATWAIAVGMACVPLFLLAISPWVLTGRAVAEFGDVEIYYHVADRISQGLVPYRDFLLEYPIGSVPLFVLPILAGGDASTYRNGFIAEMLLVNALLVLVLAGSIERQEGRAAVPRRLVWYVCCYLLLCRLIACRLDVVPALLAFLAAENLFADRRTRGGILAALGALVKMVPALAIIPAGLREISRPRQTRLRGSIAFACAFALGMVVWGVVGGTGLLESFRYHAERGLEVESLGAGLIMLVGRLTRAPLAVVGAHGALELQSDWTPAAIAASRNVQLLALALTLLPFVRSRRRSGVQCTGALLLAFMMTAPVLSPQYLIWALPFVLVMSGPLGRRVRPLFVLTCALTYLIYPVLFNRHLLALQMPAIVLLNVRNALVIALWALMAFGPSGDRNENDARSESEEWTAGARRAIARWPLRHLGQPGRDERTSARFDRDPILQG
jgi:hypothetical protein